MNKFENLAATTQRKKIPKKHKIEWLSGDPNAHKLYATASSRDWKDIHGTYQQPY